jgi:hypothetical protein
VHVDNEIVVAGRTVQEVADWLDRIGYALAPATLALRRLFPLQRWMVWWNQAPYPGAGRPGLLMFQSVDALDHWFATTSIGPLLLADEVMAGLGTWAACASSMDIDQMRTWLQRPLSTLERYMLLHGFPLPPDADIPLPQDVTEALRREKRETLEDPYRSPASWFSALTTRQWGRGATLFNAGAPVLWDDKRGRINLIDECQRIVDLEEHRRLGTLPPAVVANQARRL